jgi:hypothetical protein
MIGLLAIALALGAAPAPLARVEAKISDAAGAPAAGAELYVYKDADTRRPADFISARSDAAGRCGLALPPGKYWVVARLRQKGRFGPLSLGDKHSGAPQLVEVSAGESAKLELPVLDLREATRPRKPRADLFTVSGAVTSAGKPVAGRYVFVRSASPGSIPAHLSAWTGEDGRYHLELPAGAFELSVAEQFPPAGGEPALRRVELKSDLDPIDLAVDAAAEPGGPK